MSTAGDRSKPLRTAAPDGVELGPMAYPDPRIALASRHMAHRNRRGPVQLLAGLLGAIAPASWHRSDSTGSVGATDSTSAVGETGAADPKGAAGSAEIVGAFGSSNAGEIARLNRKYGPRAAGRGRTAGPRGQGLAGSLGRLGRRFLPREPHRREFAAVLVLVLVACALSASLPGVWAAHPASSDPNGRPAAILDPADPTAWASESIGNSSPSPTDVTPSPSPSPSDSPTPSPTTPPTTPPTKAPTKAPVKAPPQKVYAFVALGDSLTYGYGDPGPSWPVRVDAKDAQLRLVANAGVSGDTTGDMRARLNSDVFPHKPDMLFVMGGTNDIGRNISLTTTIANLRAIVVAAKAKGIRVILMTIPPTSYPAMAASINSLNAQIIYLGNIYGLIVVDVHAPLSTSAGVYISKYTSDGLHLTTLGTQVVANTIFKRCQAARF